MGSNMDDDDMHPTKIRLLDAAEQLFAAKGFDGTSMRAIVAEAGFQGQLALLHYHFGSKQDIYRTVWERALAHGDAGAGDPGDRVDPRAPLAANIRALVESFFLPPAATEAGERDLAFLTIMNREIADPRHGERGLIDTLLEPRMRRLVELFAALLPDTPHETIYYAVRTMISVAQGFLGDNFVGPDGGSDLARRREALRVGVEIFIGGWLRIADSGSDPLASGAVQA
jgi:AcrR family transcriptional regulator